jgi:hypothetical protein
VMCSVNPSWSRGPKPAATVVRSTTSARRVSSALPAPTPSHTTRT